MRLTGLNTGKIGYIIEVDLKIHGWLKSNVDAGSIEKCKIINAKNWIAITFNYHAPCILCKVNTLYDQPSWVICFFFQNINSINWNNDQSFSHIVSCALIDPWAACKLTLVLCMTTLIKTVKFPVYQLFHLARKPAASW